MKYLSRIKYIDDFESVYEILKKTVMKREFDGLSMQNSLGYVHAVVDNFSKDFFVIRNEKNEIMGIARSFQYKPEDGHVNIDLFVEEEFESQKSEILREFMDYLFTDYPLRKVYCELLEEDVQFYVAKGFEIEVTLKEYIFIDGVYKDTYLLGMTRETFYADSRMQ